jgi:hypothetical protein
VIVRRCIWRGDSRTTGESAMVSTAEILRFAQDDDTFGHTETENLAPASSTNVSGKAAWREVLLVSGSRRGKSDRENFAHDVMRPPKRVSEQHAKNPKAKPMTRDRSSWSGSRLLGTKRIRHLQYTQPEYPQPAAVTLRSFSYFLRIQETPYISLDRSRGVCTAGRLSDGLTLGGASPARTRDILATKAGATEAPGNAFRMGVFALPPRSSFPQ